MAENEISFSGGRLAKSSSLVKEESSSALFSFSVKLPQKKQHLVAADLTKSSSFWNKDLNRGYKWKNLLSNYNIKSNEKSQILNKKIKKHEKNQK